MITTTILDHTAEIRVDEDVFRNPANEYWALNCHWIGMDQLYKNVAAGEQHVHSKVPADRVLLTSPSRLGVDCRRLTCYFHWYAMSAYQYVLLVGAIHKRTNPSAPLPDKYVSDVIPEIKMFRDKIAAHHAWAKSNKKDNAADRLQSVLPPLMYKDGRFEVGGFQVTMRSKAQGESKSSVSPWSLTQVHENLRCRYPSLIWQGGSK